MKVDRPRARSSAAPDPAEQLVDDADPRLAPPARTSPICASSAISAFCRRKVDLPAMFGPVISQSGRAPGRRRRARSRWRRSCRRSAAAPARPPDAGRRRRGSRGPRRPPGAPSPRARARSASALATSISASARAVAADRPGRAPARRRAGSRRSASRSPAHAPPALRIFVSISASASVVKRTALAVVWRCTKSSASGGVQHPLGVRRRRLDEVAEHVVVPDLQRPDPAPPHVLGLQLGDDPAPLVAQPPRLVELRVVARRDEAAVAHQQRRLGDQRRRRAGRPAPRARRAPPAPRPAPPAARPPAPRAAARPAPARRGSPRGRAARRGRAPAATARAPGPAPCAAARAPPARRPAPRGSTPPPPAAPGPAARRSRARSAASPAAARRRRSPCGRSRRAASPRAPPARLRVSSRLRRVAASICISPPAPSRTGGRKQRQPPALRQLQVVDDRPERRRPRPAPNAREAVERPAPGRPRRPAPRPASESKLARASGVATAPASASSSRSSASCASETSTSRGASRASIGPSCTRGHSRHRQVAGRDVDPGERALAAHLGEGGEIVVPPRLEQALLGQRARRDQPHHLAPHHRLRRRACAPRPDPPSARRPRPGSPCGSASAGSRRRHAPARRTSGCPAPRCWPRLVSAMSSAALAASASAKNIS